MFIGCGVGTGVGRAVLRERRRQKLEKLSPAGFRPSSVTLTNQGTVGKDYHFGQVAPIITGEFQREFNSSRIFNANASKLLPQEHPPG
jgi:hypothetical protein